MSALEILLPNGRTGFKPGEKLEGNIRWTLAAPPQKLELQLLWHTSGKGSSDVRSAGSLVFHPGSSSGSESFSFQLPTAPYSFSGKLISLTWTLELLAHPGDELARQDFTLSPSGSEIVLPDTSQPAPKFQWGPLKSGH